MTGSFPRELMALTKLTALDLSQNTFTGSVPTEIGLMTDLKILNFSAFPCFVCLLILKAFQLTTFFLKLISQMAWDSLGLFLTVLEIYPT